MNYEDVYLSLDDIINLVLEELPLTTVINNLNDQLYGAELLDAYIYICDKYHVDYNHLLNPFAEFDAGQEEITAIYVDEKGVIK